MICRRQKSNLKVACRVGIAGLILTMSAACQDTSPKLVPPPAIVPIENVKDTGDGNRKANGTFDAALDILFVVDDSASMESHQQDLAANIPAFVNGIRKNRILDYHIGVVTSSVNEFGSARPGTDGILVGSPNFMDRQTPNGDTLLAQNLMVGTGGNGKERFFKPAMLALGPDLLSTLNQGFYRPTADLAVVFVTDAEDQSDESADEFVTFLKALKNSHDEKIHPLAAIIRTGDSTVGCPRDDDGVTPTKIERYLQMFNSKPFGLCDPDFGKNLADFAGKLADSVGHVYYLQRRPVRHTIRVFFGTQEIFSSPKRPEAGWTYDNAANSIVFGRDIKWSKQPPGTKVSVTFDVAQPPVQN